MRVKRDVQYCQWEEVFIELPQSFSSPSKRLMERKSTPTRRAGQATCIPLLPLPHLSRVDSSQFKESKTHYNPQRNPYPAYVLPLPLSIASHVKMPRKLLVGNYIVEKEYFLEFVYEPPFPRDSSSLFNTMSSILHRRSLRPSPWRLEQMDSIMLTTSIITVTTTSSSPMECLNVTTSLSWRRTLNDWINS